MNKYLGEAESAIKGSKSKKQLFEAVQNLAEALKEVQNLGNLDLQAMKGELNFYRKYFDHAVEMMKDTDETAPFDTEVLRKGLPILDRNIKRLIEEIQKKQRRCVRHLKELLLKKLNALLYRKGRRWPEFLRCFAFLCLFYSRKINKKEFDGSAIELAEKQLMENRKYIPENKKEPLLHFGNFILEVKGVARWRHLEYFNSTNSK